MSDDHRESLATRLYRGHVSYDFIGRQRRWYAMSAVVILVGILSLGIRGLNPSIDFKGGGQFQGPLNGHSISVVSTALNSVGINPEVVQTTGSGSDTRFQIETPTLTQTTANNQVVQVENALVKALDIKRSDLNVTTVGSTWGSQITHKAIVGLIVFMIAVVIYLSVRFEWKMALAATIALVHDLVITAGIYSLSGLQVSPSTVIALLTILGYSLYDTVVVFDKVRENTAGITSGSRMTFTQATNLAVNQTLVRSINTSIIALLPVIGLLVIGAGLLGAGSLKDLSLALFIGLASGAYSSIFIASPLLCTFKEREPALQQLARRVQQRQVKEGRVATTLQPATAGAPFATTDPGPVAADSPADPQAAARADAARARAGQAQQRRRSRGGRPGGRGTRSHKRR